MTPDLAPDAVFAAPWEAQIFAIMVALHERGAFEWREFADLLAAAVRSPDRAGYYGDWLNAALGLLQEKGLLEPDTLIARAQAIVAERAADHHHHAHLAPIAIG